MRKLIMLASILVGVAFTAQAQDRWEAAALQVSGGMVRPPARALATTVFGVCDDLASGKFDPLTAQAGSCCSKDACARLLSTVILKFPRHELRT